MGKQTHGQAVADLEGQIREAKFRRVNAEIKTVLDREGVAFQAYLQYLDGGVIPMVRLVERKAQEPLPNADGKAEEGGQQPG